MKNYVLFLLGGLLLVQCTPKRIQTEQSETTVVRQGQQAEYDDAAVILMHQPSEELFLGVIHPRAALFDVYFNLDEAAKEHELYRWALEASGARVCLLKDLLLKGTVNGEGDPVEGKELDELRAFADSYLVYNMDSILHNKQLSAVQKDSLCAQHKSWHREVLQAASPADLVRIILRQPTVYPKYTDNNTGTVAEYRESPVMNMFFMRDQMITTAKGVVIGRMNSQQRTVECDIAGFALKKLGITPIGQIGGEGAYLEGGDFLPFGNKAFIGCGMRTTQAAIDQLMQNDWLGCDSLVVVKDHWLQQEQMHLDTYFNVIDKNLVTMIENRYKGKPATCDYVSYDLWVRKEEGAYRKVAEEQSFVDFLENELKVTVLPISVEDGKTYANNFLTVGARRIVAVDGQSEDFRKALEKQQVTVTWVPIPNLVKGYGAAHCMTQVLLRNPAR